MNSKLKRPARWVAQAAAVFAALSMLASCDALLQYGVTGAKGEPAGLTSASEGSVSSPIPLTLGFERSGKVSSERPSYYKITPSASGFCKLAFFNCSTYGSCEVAWTGSADFSSLGTSYMLYPSSSSSYSVPLSTSSSTYEVKIAVTAGVPVYVKVKKNSGSTTYGMKAFMYDGKNEGSSTNPVVLTADVAYNGKVGMSGGSDFESFYKFTATSTGYYDFKMFSSSQNQTYYMYNESSASQIESSSNFMSNQVSTSSAEVAFYTGQYVAAGSSVYLKVKTYSGSYDLRYYIVVRTVVMPTNPATYGSIASPISLSSGVPINSKLAAASDSTYRYNYYKFTVATSGTAVVAVSSISPSADIDYYLYSDSAFTSSETSSLNDSGFSYYLSAGTYYLKLNNYSSFNTSFVIKVNTP